MPCDRCADLCVQYQMRFPAELRRVIDIARRNLKDGTTAEAPNSGSAVLSNIPFSEVNADGPWDDVFHYRFRCTHCGELFSLMAETYHGSGGTWQPEIRRLYVNIPTPFTEQRLEKQRLC